jgi:hypothetical protein
VNSKQRFLANCLKRAKIFHPATINQSYLGIGLPLGVPGQFGRPPLLGVPGEFGRPPLLGVPGLLGKLTLYILPPD